MAKAPSRHNIARLIAQAGTGALRQKADVSPDTPWLRYKPGTIENFPISEIDLFDASFRFRDFDSQENKEFVERLQEDLRENKEQEDPILLVFRPPKKKAVIVDGWTRVMALKNGGASTVLARFADYNAKDIELEKRRFRRHALRRDYALAEIFAYFKKKKEQGMTWSVREMTTEFGYSHVNCALISRGLNDDAAAKVLLTAKTIREAQQRVHGKGDGKAANKESSEKFRPLRVASCRVAKGDFKLVIESRGPEDSEFLFEHAAKWVADTLNEIKISMDANTRNRP